MLILSVIMIRRVATSSPQGTLDLIDAVDGNHNVFWEEGSEPATFPCFDVKVMITNVTDIVATVFSIHWDPTILNLTNIVGVPPFSIPGWPDYLLPAPGGVSPLVIFAVNFTAGNLKEASQTQLYPFSPKTFTDPNWGWVATLTFKVIATTLPIQTEIVIVDDPDVNMATEWTAVTTAFKFATLGTCRFTYVLEGTMPPVALFTATPTVVAAGETVYFNASASSDDGYIVEYFWDFGDGTNATGVTTTHAYTAAGSYTVTLTVTDDDDLWDYDKATITVQPPGGDVAVINVVPSVSEAYRMWTIQVNVTVLNNGAQTINCTVATYYNASTWYEIGKQNVTNLLAGENTTLTFNWTLTGVPYCNRTVKANATLLNLVDINLNNNEFVVYDAVKVKMAGDVNCDEWVDYKDLGLLAAAYGSLPGDPDWNLQCDFNDDSYAGSMDLFMLALNYGKSY